MRSLATLLVALLLLLALPTTTWAQTPAPQSPASTANSFVVQPESDQPREEIGLGYFRFGLSPGETRDVRVVVKNTATEPLTVRADGVDAVQVLDGGIDYAVLGKLPAAAGTWLKITPSRLTLQPGETQRLTATIVVPSGTVEGDHVAGIAVQNEQVQSGGAGSNVLIDIHYRQVIAVLATVPGQDSTAAAV